MSETSDAPAGRVYRDTLAVALGAALGAGLLVALADLMLTRSRAGLGAGSAAELWAVIAGLYAVPALLFGVTAGVVGGAFRATYGQGALGRAYRRLRDDRRLDVQVTGGLLAAGAVALGLIKATSVLAMGLVAGVQRQSTGALLMGLAVVALIPLLFALSVPVYRITRAIARGIPRLGPLPAALVVALAAVIAVIAAGLYFVFTQLEWRALDFWIVALLGGYPALALGWVGLWYGPLSGVRERIPARGRLVAAAVALAVLVPFLTLRGQPGAQALSALTEQSAGARILVGLGRRSLDRDGDGFSAFLGGPDCDDGNPDVNPEAKEIPGNGIDDNCLGGDRAPESATPDAGAAGSAQEPARSAAPVAARAQNLLLVVIDTVRADRLGVAGYTRDGKSLTPRLDQLARAGGYFTRAYAQAPNTPRSLPSFFASRYPSQIKVHRDFHNFPQVLDDNLLLFEILRAGGMHTVGYASHFYFEERRNVHQGFELFDNEGALDIKGSNKDIAAPRIVPKVTAKLAELGRSKQRFAMFVHLFEPHSTYVVHDEFPITERGIPGLVQKYDYEIAFVDIWLGRILDALAESGLDEDTMVVVLSDHGEAFGVHRVAGEPMFFHGQTIYDELLRVPLVVRVPGVPAGVHDDVVMLVDVAPTIVEALGMNIPESFVGRSLLGRMLGQPLPPKPAYGELLPAPSWNHSARMVVGPGGKHKLIHRISDKRFELYDLEADPEERKDLSEDARASDIRAELSKELVRWVEVDLP